MPVEFLSDEEAAAYGAFVEVPSQAELERWGFLDDADLKLVNCRRVDHLRRLGGAVVALLEPHRDQLGVQALPAQ